MRLTERLAIRCTPEERRAIIVAAAIEHKSVSQFIRDSVLEVAHAAIDRYELAHKPWGCRYCTREHPCGTESCVQNSLEDRQRIQDGGTV
jgi:hypothetical protein